MPTQGKSEIIMASGMDGRMLTLRPLKKTDNENVCRWMLDPYILQNSLVVPSPKGLPHDFATHDYAMRYFEMLISDKNRVSLAIMLDRCHVGNIGLKKMDSHKKSAECFIEIGEKKFRGMGIGYIAMNMLLDMAFMQYELDDLILDVLEFNLPALKIYDRLRFKRYGVIDWHYDEFGQYWKVLQMRLTMEDWRASRAEFADQGYPVRKDPIDS